LTTAQAVANRVRSPISAKPAGKARIEGKD
jgi:hypothetical protein